MDARSGDLDCPKLLRVTRVGHSCSSVLLLDCHPVNLIVQMFEDYEEKVQERKSLEASERLKSRIRKLGSIHFINKSYV